MKFNNSKHKRYPKHKTLSDTPLFITRIIAGVIFSLITLILTSCNSSNNNRSILNDESPGVKHPDTAGFRIIERIEYEEPISAYNFDLIDQNNSQITLGDLKGKVVMVGFIYTHCPEACPIVAANFKMVQNQLIEHIDSEDLVLVLITTDPENDTPERLLRYTKALNGNWHFLTGELEDLQKVWDGYDIYWEKKDRNKEVAVFHSYKTYIIDKEGKLRYEFIGVWFPDDIIPDLGYLISE